MSGISQSVAQPSPPLLAELPPEALNCATMLPAMKMALGLEIESLTIERVHFSKSRPVTIHYRYHAREERDAALLVGEVMGAAARGHFEAESHRLRKVRRSQLGPDDTGSLALIAEHGIVLRKPGLDAKLPGLRLLHDTALARDVACRGLGVAAAGATVSVALKAHRLGKRAVLRAELLTAGGQRKRCYLRLRPTSNNDGPRAFEQHRSLAASLAAARVARAPAPLHYDAEWGAAVYSELPGECPSFSDGASGMTIGAALGEFRALAPANGERWTVLDELHGLDQWPARLGQYLPRWQRGFEVALQRLAGDLDALPAFEFQSCHRDFHEGQVLLSDDCCGLIDFDTWCSADSALDIGNFTAHIRLWEMRTGASAARFTGDFLAGNAIAGGRPSAAHIRVWKRAALLRLGAIYAFASEPSHVVERLLAEAKG